MIRYALLRASENRWLGQHACRLPFLRRSVRRFLPGETLEDALGACGNLAKANLPTVLTYLGESVTERQEALAVTTHYAEVLKCLEKSGIPTEISVKLTQLGLDLDPGFCLTNFLKLLNQDSGRSTIWIDMEQSSYVDRTLQLVERARATAPNVGVCVQAYLRRTENDVVALIANGTAVRLVKGAYAEPVEVAFRYKREVDENYFCLAKRLLGKEARRNGVRTALATHDPKLIQRITQWAEVEGLSRSEIEFQMLYGIQREQQRELARTAYRCRVLISYGGSWFPWFMRRLAERPANVLFLVRNLF